MTLPALGGSVGPAAWAVRTVVVARYREAMPAASFLPWVGAVVLAQRRLAPATGAVSLTGADGGPPWVASPFLFFVLVVSVGAVVGYYLLRILHWAMRWVRHWARS